MFKRLLIAFALFALCSLLFTACGGTESNANSNTTNAGNANKPAATSSPAMAASPASATAGTGDKIGVPECDDYLEKYEACVTGKVPEAARAQYKSAMEQTRKSWRDLAGNPQTKASLVEACKMATDQAKQTFKMFGCDF